MKPIKGGDFWFIHPNVPVYAFNFKKRNIRYYASILLD